MNINDRVEVTLTDRGRLVLYKYEVDAGVPVHSKHNMTGDRLRLPLWELMHIFGPAMVMGDDPCFEKNEVRLESYGPKTEEILAKLRWVQKHGEWCSDSAALATLNDAVRMIIGVE